LASEFQADLDGPDFDLTKAAVRAKLTVMTKQEIKDRLLQAVKSGPHLADIKSLAVFGSYVSGTAGDDSDVDVLIDFLPSAAIGFFALSDIKHNIEAYLQRPVDLVTRQAISKYFRDEVLAQAEYVYKK
jgi:predicted nucleotidyltransferase